MGWSAYVSFGACRCHLELNWTELWHTHSWSSPSMAQNQAENKGRKGGTKGRKRENKKVLSSREVNIETSSHQTTSHASVYHNASQTSHWASDYHTASPNQGLPQRITKPGIATLHLQTKDCHSESPNQWLPHCISKPRIATANHQTKECHTASPNQGLPQRITKPRIATLHLKLVITTEKHKTSVYYTVSQLTFTTLLRTDVYDTVFTNHYITKSIKSWSLSPTLQMLKHPSARFVAVLAKEW